MERRLKLTGQCCSHHRVTAPSELSSVDCRDNNTIVSSWGEVRQRDNLPTH